MSATKRKAIAHSNALEQSSASNLSGAEMLVLQQNIKQYIITRQSRPLTVHELEEFEKIKEQLLPSLLRYSQPTAPSLTEGSSSSSGRARLNKAAPSQPNRKALPSLQAQPEIYPTSEPMLPAAQTSGRALSNPAKTKAGAKSKHPTLKPESSNTPRNSKLPLAVLRSTSSSGLVANSPKSGEKKKRPRIDVYHDPENTNQKRSRRKPQGDAGDSDKENRNPLDPVPSRQGKGVLKDNTNLSNNATKSLVPKDKNETRKTATTKTSTVSAANTTTKTKQKATAGTRQMKSSVALTSTLAAPAAGRTLGKNTAQSKKSRMTVFKDTDVPLVKETQIDIPRQELVSGDPIEATKVNSQSALQHDAGNEPEGVIEDTTAGTQIQTELRPAKAAEASVSFTEPVTEILASVDDDDRTTSFEPYVKLEGDISPVMRRSAVEPEEIPGSEDSADLYISHGSQEEPTFPMPGFLADGALEDSDDEATFPMPDFLESHQLEGHHSAAEELEYAVESKVTNAVLEFQTEPILESTIFMDGAWCISNHKSGANAAVCGNKEKWIALETNLHVQFWQLSDSESLLDSKWCQRIQLSKTSSYPTQIVFAPDDSFAVVLNPTECSFIKVSLEECKETARSESRHVTVVWSGLKPSLTCRSFIIGSYNEEGSITGYRLVFGVNAPGSIGLIPIPDEDVMIKTKAKTLCYLGSDELASSIAKVDNTASLILASFGTAMVLWDLDKSSVPASVVDASFVLSPLPSPQLTYPSMAPTIVTAAVPKQFFKEYEDTLQSENMSPSNWPILAVLMMCDTEVDDSVRSESERCALYVMKGDSIELVHKYIGTQSISFATSSSRFVACQTKCNGKDNMYLWDILKPEAVVQLSLLDSPSQQDILSQKQPQPNNISHLDIAPNTPKDSREESQDTFNNETADLLSSASTLSPPPAELSSSPYLPFDDRLSESRLDLSTPDQPLEPACSPVSQRQQRQPKEWIDLTSVSWTERKRAQFSVQQGQHWVVVVQHDMPKQNSSVVHIMDLMSILSATM